MPLHTNHYDVVVCGGGLAGLTFAMQLKSKLPDVSVCVLEKQAGPLPDGTHKVGESLTEGGTWLFRELAGLKAYIESTHVRKLGLRFFGAGYRQQGFDKRFEVGDVVFARNSSFQLDRGILENDLRRFCRERGVHVQEGVSVRDVQFGEQDHTVSFAFLDDKHEETATCRWVVDATGRRRFLQSKLGLCKPAPHNASSTWWRIQRNFDVSEMAPRENGEWHDRVFAKRRNSTNHLMGPGYFVWVIPLCSGMTSIGIAADEAIHPISARNTYEKSMAWLREQEPSLHNAIRQDAPLDFLALKNYAHTTHRAYSADRWTCIGESAAFTDPLYSMGTDLIAHGNRATIRMIELDRAGTLTPAIVDSYNSLYLKVVDVMLGLFHGTYGVFGDDRVAMVKLMWDIACYWAFFSQLSIQNFLDDEANLPKLHDLVDRLGLANQRAQSAFRVADKLDRERTCKSGFFGFGGVSSVTALRATVTTPRTVEATAANIDFMAHEFAPALCRFLGVESDSVDSGTERLIPMIETYVAPESRQLAFAVGGRA